MAPGPTTGAAAASLGVGFLVQGLWNRGVGSAPSSAEQAAEATSSPPGGFGLLDGLRVLAVGALLGADEGAVVGSSLKLFGAFVGAEVGTCDGAIVGCEVGLGAMWHSVPSHTFPFKDPGLPVHSVATMGHA